MVMTILEAPVDRENWQTLKDIFDSEVRKLDPGLVHTYLLQAKKDENIWRIVTVWESQEALDKMRASGETPRGVVMFRSASAEPTLTLFNILSQGS